MSFRDPHTLARWRLVLGKSAECHAITCAGDAECQRIEQLVGFLFEPGAGGSSPLGMDKVDRHDRYSQRSGLTIPEWVDQVRELFPQQAKEVLEKELVQRRGIRELLDKPDLLAKVEPNLDLVKTLLTHRDLMNPQTRVLARKIIDQVVEELKKRMKVQVEAVLVGGRPDLTTPLRMASIAQHSGIPLSQRCLHPVHGRGQ
jgi:hypothetical protein